MFSERRKSRNLTQSDLALKIGVSRSTVAMWEGGRAMPRSDLLPRIAEILDCTIDDLFENERR